ncbi:MAG TPA: hypothetical protein VFM95_02705 [Microcella sp.]|nr:hypothetical protein [Microcella sp.]
MTMGKEIIVDPCCFEHAFAAARKGSVWTLTVHGLEWPVELRRNPPRVRLLEDGKRGRVRCELLDPWPDAPRYWPPARGEE